MHVNELNEGGQSEWCKNKILPDLQYGAGIMCVMTREYFSDADAVRTEIAVAAARLIAEEGASYGAAKHKAAKQVLGNDRASKEFLPDNELIENEVRIYNELFLGDSQPARLRRLRQLALEVMEELEQFQPYLTGAVMNGTAGEHSDIHLQLFTDNPKDVEMFLLNRDINFEVSEIPHFRPNRDPVETLSFMREGEGVHLVLYQTNDVRGALKARRDGRIERADMEMVKLFIEQDAVDS